MQDEVMVSVIVPVYQGEQYLAVCLDSLCCQTFKSLEIIVINDGSTDKSTDIVKSYQNKDQRIRFIESDNKGVGNARNLGLEAAKGKYIGFLDADDWADAVMFEKLINGMMNTDADLVICNVNVHHSKSEAYQRLKLENETFETRKDKSNFISKLMDFNFDYSNWNKLYKTEIIRQNDISFCSEMKIWEDLLFNLEYCHYASRVSVLNLPLYNYRIHEQSVMHRSRSLLISQFNLLFEKYEDFSARNNNAGMFLLFNHKMAEMAFNTQIPMISDKFSVEKMGILKSIKSLKKHLQSFNNRIFRFDQNKLRGFQGYKRKLLTNGNYGMFSCIITLRNHFKS